MMPGENFEVAEADERYPELVNCLIAGRVSPDEAHHLHMWLVDQVNERVVRNAIETALGTETLTEQIKACTKLITYASAISEQFNFLNQVSSLESAISRTFCTIETDNSLPARSSSASRRKYWRAFRDRLEADTALLARVAERTIVELKERGSKKGRPAKTWRNNLLTELVDRLRQLGNLTQEECIDISQWIWNLYFENECIESSDTTGKIITRERNRRKNQGQNAV